MGKKLDFTYPINMQFSCSRCGLCCGDTPQKTRRILLLESETKRISFETYLPTEIFTREIISKTPYKYEMKKDNAGKCFFLRDNKCSIYLFRPLICRFYPFDLKYDQQKKQYTFNFTIECQGISKGKIKTFRDFEELFLLAKDKLC